jgi:hypothetical protein
MGHTLNKPGIITADDPRWRGKSGKSLEDANARIQKSGVWKKQRTILLLPAGDSMDVRVAMAMRALGFPPNNGMQCMMAVGTEVGEAYSNAIMAILEHPEFSKWEYLLTMEHDNLPPPDGAIRLIERMEQYPELSAIGGLYWTKGDYGVPQIWGDPTDPIVNYRPQPADPNGGVRECCGTGMGFTMFRLRMFKDKKLRRPWFKTQTKDGVATQDLYFWNDARVHGYRCGIDCSVRVGHLDAKGDYGPPGTVW